MSPNQPTEPKPTVTRNSSEFNRDAYASIPSGELVVFAVQVLQADGSPAATEDIVSICFRFFPHSFALKNYFYWPDSALVTRRLHDAKEKGLLKGSAADGFEVKVPGRQAAKQVAKALKVVFPAPPKVEVPAAPVEENKEEKKESAPSAPIVKAVKKQETPRSGQAGKKKEQKKKAVKPALKKQTAKAEIQLKPKKKAAPVKPVKKKAATKPKAQPKPAPRPKVTAAKKPVAKIGKKDERRKKVQIKAAHKAPIAKKPLVKVEKNAVKKRETVRKATQPTVKPVVKKAEKVVEKKQVIRKKEAKAIAHPKQLTMPLPPPAAWKKAEVPAAKPKVRHEPSKPVLKEAAAPMAVSKEEKDKAAKVVKQIERSDAYQLYRRNGRRANIGEFDFRNMLFATMESSAETLKRNLDLFKRYAGFHFRADLIAFLEFCEENFSALLISKVKVKGKR